MSSNKKSEQASNENLSAIRIRTKNYIESLAGICKLNMHIDEKLCLFGSTIEQLKKNIKAYSFGKSVINAMGYICITYTIPMFAYSEDIKSKDNYSEISDTLYDKFGFTVEDLSLLEGINIVSFVLDENDTDFSSVSIANVNNSNFNVRIDFSDEEAKEDFFNIFGERDADNITADELIEFIESLSIPDIYMLMFSQLSDD